MSKRKDVLLMTTSLTRHGTRAPNIVVTDACPGLYDSTTAIVSAFGAAPGHLTQRGIEAMRKVGRWIRKEYIDDEKFVPDRYTYWGNLWTFRAIQEHRHLTSAAAIAQGIFPGQPVAIFSEPKVVDNLLATPPAACASETRDHAVKWLSHEGKTFFSTQPGSKTVLEKIDRVCKRSMTNPVELSTVLENQVAERKNDHFVPARVPGNPHPVFQDLTDLFNFMHDQSIVPKAYQDNPDAFSTLRRQCTDISLAMMQKRMFEDPATMTRFCGQFPSSLHRSMVEKLSHARRVLATRGNDPDYNMQPKFYVYVSSRELLYALSHYFGIRFKSIRGKPEGYIMAGTTLVWELHVRDQGLLASVLSDQGTASNQDILAAQRLLVPENAFVRVYSYYPSMDETTSFDTGEVEKVRMLMKMDKCDTNCPLNTFGSIVNDWTRKVGTFDSLCPVKHHDGEDRHVKKNEKDDKKVVKKEEKAHKKEREHDEHVFAKDVKEYVRLNCERSATSTESWVMNKADVTSFCEVCVENAPQCEGILSKTSSSSAHHANPSGGATTTQHSVRLYPMLFVLALILAAVSLSVYTATRLSPSGSWIDQHSFVRLQDEAIPNTYYGT